MDAGHAPLRGPLSPLLRHGVLAQARAGIDPDWIGGISRAALRRAARVGDGWHPLGLSPDALAPAMATLREEAIDAGRDPASIPVSIAMTLAESTLRRHALGTEPDEIVRSAQAYAALGIDTLVISVGAVDATQARAVLDMVAREVRPAVRA